MATSGDSYKMYVSNAVNIGEVTGVREEQAAFYASSFCMVNDSEICILFEKPKDWNSDIKCWAWDAAGNFTGGIWSGMARTKVSMIDTGNEV